MSLATREKTDDDVADGVKGRSEGTVGLATIFFAPGERVECANGK